MMKKIFCAMLVLGSAVSAGAQIQTNAGVQYLQAMQKDMSTDFYDLSNTYFLADSLSSFDAATGEGLVNWKRYRLSPRQAFNLNGYWPVRMQMLDFPDAAYVNDPDLKIKIDFISPRTVRVRMLTTPVEPTSTDQDDVMFSDQFKQRKGGAPWQVSQTADAITYRSDYGTIEIRKYPWRLVIKDAQGKVLTQTRHSIDNDSSQVKLLPFSFIKRGSDNSRSVNPVLTLAPGERIYGCGESFTSLNKVGQKVHLSVTDPQGPETDGEYKPVPFFFSNRGYGVFMHTSAPVTCDFGASYIGADRLFMADEQMDFFLFLGEPKDILNEYTNITGKSPMLPLWSFGTWMSRITYFSQAEGLEIARQLRANRIPSDVIHFDTGWFGVDWQCDYQFAKDRFPNPVQMLKQLSKDGFHTCLWQLPYFTPKNRFFPEIIAKGMHVKNADGGMPVEDAVLDFSNPSTVSWYQQKIEGLLKQGVSTIKCDFGEAAPYNGFYHSGKGGLYEHNLYPLRYNKALWEVVERNHPGEGIIWARSAWAGSQRYALHWGGDAATTNTGLLGDLRGGLSFGLSGFSFWSHDMGGFVTASPEDIYRRWLPFGFLSSHTRAHGAPPTEPWLISESFTEAFRDCAEMKYKLMPYVYAQAKDCSERGLPMVRALLVEFPQDPGAWLVEDEYMFGSQILVAPLMESGNSRTVYLPKGKWIDYQNGKIYEGGYQTIEAGKIPAVILVRDGSLIPHVPLAQRTDEIDWNAVEMKVYCADSTTCTGLLFKPGDKELQIITKNTAEVSANNDNSQFVTLTDAVPDAILEIRYYGTYNFVGTRIDGYEEPKAMLTKEAAAALKAVSDDVKAQGYRLKIYDAYRPQQGVDHFMRWAQNVSDTKMKAYFYPDLDKSVLFDQEYIYEKSGHSRGSTVDLTLFDMKTEKELDMGGTFDWFGPESHPDFCGNPETGEYTGNNSKSPAGRSITAEQFANRMILRKAMLAHGFKPLASEWWHFTLKNEPFPDTYFTFPVK